MSRCIIVLFLTIALPSVCFAQAGPPPGAPIGPPDMPIAPGLPIGPPPQGIALWPAGARVQQMFELGGDDLKQVLKGYPDLAGVRRILIADYIVPGPPAPPVKILEFYTSTLCPPAWRPFFQSARGGPDVMSIAFKGPGGFISVLARPNGATVTHIQGELDLSSMPLLERVVRETVASRGGEPIEVRDKVDAALRRRAAGKTDEAVRDLRAVVAQYPMSAMAHFNLARILAEQRKFDEAGQHFRRAIGLSPLNAAFHAEYAQLLVARGDLENAQYELEQAATLDPWSAPLQLLLGRVMETRGMLKDAEAHYRRAIQLAGCLPEAYVDLGRVLEKQGRTKDALRAYQDALKLKSDFQPALEGIRRLEKEP